MGCGCQKAGDDRAKERAAKVAERRARIDAARAAVKKEGARRPVEPRR